ncbi:MAG: GNAT family N-acetyltransferase [Rhodobacteraceae bacterium]|nr:GNAT family N-acetyltransferase [Paracoccaceae bacterium]
MSIGVETPLQDEVRDLVAALNEYLIPLSPVEFQFQLTVEQMAHADTIVFIARDLDGKAVGMGALKIHDENYGEVKRMFTVPAVRGTGLGKRLVAAIEAEARQRGLTQLKLETGSTSGFEPAWGVYEACGFTRCGAFADYPNSEFNVFYEKNLTK